MTLDTSPARPRGLRRLFHLVAFRLIPLLLIVAIGWTLYRSLETLTTRMNDAQNIEARRELYQQTATAMANSVQHSASPANNNTNDTSFRLIQFVTNTPVAPNPANATATATMSVGGGFLVTNTPLVSATPVPSNTPIIPTSTPEPTSVPMATPVALPTFYFPQGTDLSEIAGTAVPTQVPTIPRNYELVNILLLGGDDEVTEDNTIRTDTMIIVSVNTETQTVAMLALPRDLFVFVPTPSMQRLNTVYGIGESYGWSAGGFGLLRETIFYNFGINVHYYAKVNFSGFERIIDELGGVELAVDCTYEDFYPVEDFDPARPIEENYALRTLPVGYYTMNGFDALWYVRTRRLADDFDRGRRQQQLLRAIFRRGLETGVVANLPTLWGELTQVVETNLPFEVMVGLLPIALSLDATSDIEQFVMIRGYHTTPWQPASGNFAGQNVQLPNYEPLSQLLTDFYLPPTSSRLALAGASVAVYNGTTNPNLDRVAVERLRTDGFNAYAAGMAESDAYTTSVLIDQVGSDKGSLIAPLRSALNIASGDVRLEPDPNREVDYTIILGANYNSCPGGVLPAGGG